MQGSLAFEVLILPQSLISSQGQAWITNACLTALKLSWDSGCLSLNLHAFMTSLYLRSHLHNPRRKWRGGTKPKDQLEAPMDPRIQVRSLPSADSAAATQHSLLICNHHHQLRSFQLNKCMWQHHGLPPLHFLNCCPQDRGQRTQKNICCRINQSAWVQCSRTCQNVHWLLQSPLRMDASPLPRKVSQLLRCLQMTGLLIPIADQCHWPSTIFTRLSLL